jgi:hypothetical protein
LHAFLAIPRHCERSPKLLRFFLYPFNISAKPLRHVIDAVPALNVLAQVEKVSRRPFSFGAEVTH